MIPPGDVLPLVQRLPLGTTIGTADGKQYATSHSIFSGGRAHKVVAEELGGSDYISLNLYQLPKGVRLFPCEMPAEKVIAFLRSFTASS